MLGLGNILTKGGALLGFPNKYSFNFDGSNDYLDTNNSFESLFKQSFTLSAWVKIDDGQGFSEINVIFSTVKQWTGYIYFQVEDDGRIKFVHGTNSAKELNTYTDSAVFADGASDWTHVAGVFSRSSATSGSVTIYVNGSSAGSNSSPADGWNADNYDNNLYNVAIGGRNNENTHDRFFNGDIDEVSFFNTALSAPDIAKLASKPLNLSKASSYDTDRTSSLKLWLRAGDKVLPEKDASIARSDFYSAFDGSSEYVDCGNDSSLQLASDMTITGWINPTGTTSSRALVFKRDSGGTNYQLAMDTSTPPKLRFYDGSTATSSSGSLTKDRWQHIALTIDSGATDGSIFYIDGVASGTATFTISGDDADLLIGKHATDSPVTYYEGDISSVGIYKTALDAQTIKQLSKSRFLPQRQAMFSVVDFDGTNPYIVTSGNVGITGSSARTLGLWFNPTATNQYYELIEWGGTGTTNATCGLYLYSSKIFFYGWGAGDFDTGVAPLSTWQHLYATYDGTTVKVYLNGALIGSSSESLNTSDTVLKIGNSTSNEFSGSISSVSIYDVAKTEQEIYALYQKGITYDESSENGLHAYYRMGDDTSASYPTIADSSSNSNDGTITNGASDDIVENMVAGYDMGAYDNSTEELGIELFPTTNANYDVATDGAWSKDSATPPILTYNDDGANGSTTISASNISINAGSHYKLVFTVSELSSGTADITFINQALNENYLAEESFSNGTYTRYFIPSTGGGFRFRSDTDSGSSFKVSNYSIKQLYQSDLSDTYPAIIDVANPTLGAELWDADASTFDSGTHSWVNYSPSANGMENDSGALKITRPSSGGDARGAYVWLKDATDLSSNLTVGKTYKITFDAKVDSGSSVDVIVSATSTYSVTVTETSFTSKSITFISTHATDNYFAMLNMDADEIIWLDNFSLKEVQGNVGAMTSMATDNLTYSSVLPDQSFLVGNSSPYNFIDLDGSDAYIKNESFTGHQSDTGSISFWVTPRRISGNQHFVSLGGTTTTGATRDISLQGGADLKIVAYGSTTDTGFNLSADTLYHIVFTWDSTSAVAYVDNSSASLTIGALVKPQGTKLSIGVRVWDYAAHSEADFSNVGVWNKVLSSSDVSKIFNAGRNSSLLDDYSENLVAYYAFGALDTTGLADTDSTIYDRSGNSVHGTTSGVATGDLKSSPNATPHGYSSGDTNRSTTTP